MGNYFLLAVALAALGFLAYRAGRVWIDAGRRGFDPARRVGWALLGAVAPARYWWGARIDALSPQEQAELLAHKIDALGLCRADGLRCPLCGGEYLHLKGEGTEKLEEEISVKFPDLRFARLDQDAVRRRGKLEKILSDFNRGDLKLLIGTQMIAKGHDFKGVTLSAVISADMILGMPDFRAAERTFQLVTQLAGRSGRGEKKGRVIIQTMNPDHYAIKASLSQNFEEFYERELHLRRLMGYPPFSSIANIVVRGSDLNKSHDKARGIARKLRDKAGGEIRVVGPVLAPIPKIKGDYRFQIIVRGPSRRLLQDSLFRTFEKSGAGLTGKVDIDVDPYNLM